MLIFGKAQHLIHLKLISLLIFAYIFFDFYSSSLDSFVCSFFLFRVNIFRIWKGISSSCHKFSIGFRSDDWGHWFIRSLYLLNSPDVFFEVSFGRLSCWNMNRLPTQRWIADGKRFFCFTKGKFDILANLFYFQSIASYRPCVIHI